jgi:tetraacyldisaccharide 4'-kinase
MRAPAFWEERAPGPLERAALAPISALAALYALGARVHRGTYRSGLRGARRLPCRVVSVGSLAAGGAGKTPLAAWLAAALRANGRRVVLASRGYGRASAAVEVVSDGDTILCDAARAGDEPLLLAADAPGVPVVVGRDRGLAGRLAVERFGAEIVLLDDGFQHHRLARDLDLVVLDGAQGLGNGAVLPRGPLREPPSALGAADAIVVMDGPLVPEDEARVAALAPRALRFAARRVPRSVRRLGGEGTAPPASLRGRKVGLLAGIARPAGFRRTLEALGASVVAERVFPDHHPFAPGDLAGLAGSAPVWVTTEKDAVKLDPAWSGTVELLVLRIGVEGPPELARWAAEGARSAAPR